MDICLIKSEVLLEKYSNMDEECALDIEKEGWALQDPGDSLLLYQLTCQLLGYEEVQEGPRGRARVMEAQALGRRREAGAVTVY